MILMMGPAGAGKSVQSQHLVDSHGFRWISTGVILREAMQDESVRSQMEHGQLLDDETVEKIVAEALSSVPDLTKTLLDGFPRNQAQAEWLANYCKEHRASVEHVIHLKIDLKTARERLIERGRTDDHDAAITNRFKEYQQVTLPIIEYFKSVGAKIAEVSGDKSIQAVHDQIIKALGL